MKIMREPFFLFERILLLVKESWSANRIDSISLVDFYKWFFDIVTILIDIAIFLFVNYDTVTFMAKKLWSNIKTIRSLLVIVIWDISIVIWDIYIFIWDIRDICMFIVDTLELIDEIKILLLLLLLFVRYVAVVIYTGKVIIVSYLILLMLILFILIGRLFSVLV